MAEDLHSGSLYCARENEPAAYLSRVAVSAYRALAFDFSGEADAFGQHWLCYEKRL